MFKRWAILLALGTLATACADGGHEGNSAAIHDGQIDDGPQTRADKPRGPLASCSLDGLAGLSGTWVRTDGELAVIDEDMVLNGDVDLCADADGRLEQTTRGPYPSTSGHTFHVRPGLLATYAFHRDGQGTGIAGRWAAEGFASDDEWDLRWRESIEFADDGTYVWSRTTWGADEDGSEMQQGTWTQSDAGGLTRLDLSAGRRVLFTDGDAVWTDEYYTRAE